MSKSNDLTARIAEMQEKAQQRAESKQRELLPAAPTPCNVVRLPLWPDPVRAVPNGFLRSALFGAIGKGRRRYMEREQIAALEGIEIRYTGQRLDQGDLDVWETVLHIVRVQALGDECQVTAYQLLKAMGKTDTGKNRDTLDRRLSRMKATGVDVKVGRYSYEGSLIDEVYRAEDSREYIIRLNPKLRALFAPDQFTQIEWAVRQELDGKPLAQWLHGFYASHAQPYPVRVDTLLKLSGSEDVNPRSANQTLRKALDAMTKASEAHGQPFRYEIHGDLVHTEKQPSRSQQQHIARKRGRPRKPRD